MKKFLALILALVMVFSLTGIAFADTTVEGDGNGSENQNVIVNVNHGAAGKIYYVTIKWGTLAFEYDMSATEWDPESHTYLERKDEDGNAISGWQANANPTITVTNHSNDKVNVTAEFTAGGKQASNFDVTATISSNDKLLESADAEIYYDSDTADKTVYTISVDGIPSTDYNAANNIVGTIKVTVSPFTTATP
jgi:hypothetical protein